MIETAGQFFTTAWWVLPAVVLAGYLLGCINFAIIVTYNRTKKDIRDFGSGNAGATNVLRNHGKLPALLTMTGDIAKSIAAVVVGFYIVQGAIAAYFPEQAAAGLLTDKYTSVDFSLIGQYTAGLFCIIGHMFPVYYGFRGGKGVAAIGGTMLVLDWRVALIGLTVFVLTILITRYVSLGSILGSITLAVATWVFRAIIAPKAVVTITFCTGMTAFAALLVILKHIPNIKRLLNGTERKISFRKKPANEHTD